MLDTLIDEAQHHDKRITVYTDETSAGVEARFGDSSVATEQKQLPPEGPAPFVTVNAPRGFLLQRRALHPQPLVEV